MVVINRTHWYVTGHCLARYEGNLVTHVYGSLSFNLVIYMEIHIYISVTAL